MGEGVKSLAVIRVLLNWGHAFFQPNYLELLFHFIMPAPLEPYLLAYLPVAFL